MKNAALLAALAFACSGTAVADPALGVPNTSNAPPGGPPIQIEECDTGTTGGLLVSRSNGNFKIAFTNEGTVAADLIRFAIDYGNERVFIRDVGQYDPGVTVTHTYRRRGGSVTSFLGSAKMTCSVAGTHFVDGTSWAPQGPQASSAPIVRRGNGYLGMHMRATPNGLLIDFVALASAAQAAGVAQGDTLLAIDGETVTTPAQVVDLISAAPVGTVVTLTVGRAGTTQTLHATVAAAPGPSGGQ